MTPQPNIDSVDAFDLTILRDRIPRDQDAGGDPSVGSKVLFNFGSTELGIWDMGVGAMYDVEIDEAFVVLEGEGTVDVLDASGLVAETTVLRAGIVGRLYAGTRTRWTVTRTLRKVYIAPAEAPTQA
ncbi:MAG TPA: cupin domain-containing protein [Microbacterium sp.]|uniref:cupin domain-containing protein n=1 Tax=Microbacterium sp. TaxID=51671 RepID=UPI002CBF5937|nr:cupin domain-containing protein [Microbacterium sp.]HWI30040.1 cupin domain-containing protein [Microbacterium sp.]